MQEDKICSFNLTKETSDYLKANTIPFYEGSIGKVVKLNYGVNVGARRCKHNVVRPKNLHEYNKIIIDLTNEEMIDYNYDHHKSHNNKSSKDFYFICHRPKNIFDPRPFVLEFSKKMFKENLESGTLLFVFCGPEEHIDYEILDGDDELVHSSNIYSFLDTIPHLNKKYGELVKIASGDGEIYNFLKNYTDGTKYHVVFNAKGDFIDGNFRIASNFHPLMLSNKDEIVSFYEVIGESGIFFLPDIKNKGEFLCKFLKEIAPNILPHLFPESIKEKWLEESRYHVPNHQKLQDEKSAIEVEYQKKLVLKNSEIENNKLQYQFLNDLLIKTDEELVAAVIKFLELIGFENVKDGDLLNSGKLKQEDIQIETDRGLIVIEIKGIGGTSKDTDCNQIGKIKYRRAKERSRFDVFAHYIVNHQRHIPAEKRANPPFTKEQIEDAINDERGLITTWQLFNLFFAIENNIISKEQARESFYGFGLIDFLPKDKILIGKPKELINKHNVVILEMESEPKIKVNDKILIVYKDHFQQDTVVSIQKDGVDLEETETGEMGLKLTNPIKKGGVLYI
ncbi:hypothetical protein ACFE6N_22840 [Pedobacter sp. BG31]|uniref:hypothetical protein n=1 Tax=Pedobacter sp. BG31 TaxID=3349697 RepID=UPI0035F4C030